MSDTRTDPDRFLRLADGPEVESRVKGSRFVGQALAAADAEAATRRLQTIRKRHHDATHHCWAAVWGPPGANEERFDDDGEPSGSAGRPILHHLLGSGAADGLVVVTRWFGGTKLGTGGLVQAYSAAAAEALARAPRIPVERRLVLDLGFAYADLGGVEAVLGRRASWVREVSRDFGDTLRFRVEVPRRRAPHLERELVEALGGRIELGERTARLAEGRPRLVEGPDRD